MSGRVGHRKRLICVNAANLRANHFYLTGHADFFPTDRYGASSKSGGTGKQLRLDVLGLSAPVYTDIPTQAKSGKPRPFFRKRAWVGEFFAKHGIKLGDTIAIERLASHRFRVLPLEAREVPQHPAVFAFESEPEGGGLRAAEFFAGIGLVRLALEEHHWEVVFANDIDPSKLEIYQANFGSDHFRLGDIHKLTPADIPACELFTASFPCNDLSIAGAWTGLNGKESSAFWGLIRILKDMGQRRPPLVMLENVLGFLQSQGGKDFETALLALNGLGYSVDAFILNAVHWVPQSRVRLFVVAKTADAGGSGNPYAIGCDARPESLCVFINTHPNICWDIRDLPRLPKPRLTLKDIVEDLPDDDPQWWSRTRSEYFFNQLSKRHLLAATRMIEQRAFSFATAFRRVRYGRSMAELRTDGIAGCLRTPRLTHWAA